jgi:hypothetical protein
MKVALAKRILEDMVTPKEDKDAMANIIGVIKKE